MHYDQYAYSVDGKKKTMIAKDRPYKTLGGKVRGTLTTNDIRELNALYNCETVNYLDGLGKGALERYLLTSGTL